MTSKARSEVKLSKNLVNAVTQDGSLLGFSFTIHEST